MRTFVMGYDPYWKFELPSRRQVGGCWFQEEERFRWYSIVQFFSMRSIVPANAYDLGSWLKAYPTRGGIPNLFAKSNKLGHYLGWNRRPIALSYTADIQLSSRAASWYVK